METSKSNRVAIAISLVAVVSSVLTPFAIQSRMQRSAERLAKRQQGLESLDKLAADLSLFPQSMTACLRSERDYCACVENDASDEAFFFRQEQSDISRRDLYDAMVKIDADRLSIELAFGESASPAAAAIGTMIDRAAPHFWNNFDRPDVMPATVRQASFMVAEGKYDYRAAAKFCNAGLKESQDKLDRLPALMAADVQRIRSAVKALADSIRVD